MKALIFAALLVGCTVYQAERPKEPAAASVTRATDQGEEERDAARLAARIEAQKEYQRAAAEMRIKRAEKKAMEAAAQNATAADLENLRAEIEAIKAGADANEIRLNREIEILRLAKLISDFEAAEFKGKIGLYTSSAWRETLKEADQPKRAGQQNGCGCRPDKRCRSGFRDPCSGCCYQ